MRGFFLEIFPFPVVIQVKYLITIQDRCVIGQRDGLQISFTILPSFGLVFASAIVLANPERQDIYRAGF